MHHWKRQFPGFSNSNTRLILAVSGGIDSVVLTHFVHQSGFPFIIAHCNFQLRGAESERDEAFVRSMSYQVKAAIHIKKFDTLAYANEKKISIQEAARDLRYQWFEELQQLPTLFEEQYDTPGKSKTSKPLSDTQVFIVTAHHADDNRETVLMHFFRGTGIHGLTGIRPYQKELQLIRPLLPFSKEELKDFAKVNGWDCVEDSSNSSDKYTRNFFRNQVIPLIKTVYPKTDDNISDTIHKLNDAALLYDQAIARHLRKLMLIKGNETWIPVLLLKKSNPLNAVTWEIIRQYNFSSGQTNEVIRLLDAANGSYTESATHRIFRNRQWLIIASVKTGDASQILIHSGNQTIQFASGILRLEQMDYNPATPAKEIVNALQATGQQKAVLYLDGSDLSYPLLLRPWKQGDYFYPLGMQKKKKVSRFLIDLKLSPTQKANTWVLESGSRIICVLGLRLDNRFRITAKTNSVLKISQGQKGHIQN